MKKGLVKFVIFIIIILSILVITFLIHKNTEQDIECIRMSITCCSCEMGGEEVCIPKSEQEIYKNKLKNCSETNFCAAVFNCNPNECKYIKGKCQFIG